MKNFVNLSYLHRSDAWLTNGQGASGGLVLKRALAPLSMLILIVLLGMGFLLPAFAAQDVDSDVTFITIENRSGKDARVAIPGGKTVRVKDGVKSLRAELNVTKRNGVEVKAWWSLDPRQLCVIFVRYEGHVVIGGKKLIRCLGN